MRFSEPPKSEPLGEEWRYQQGGVQRLTPQPNTSPRVLFSLFSRGPSRGRGGRGPRWKMVQKAKTKDVLRGVGDTGEARQAGATEGDRAHPELGHHLECQDEHHRTKGKDKIVR